MSSKRVQIMRLLKRLLWIALASCTFQLHAAKLKKPSAGSDHRIHAKDRAHHPMTTPRSAPKTYKPDHLSATHAHPRGGSPGEGHPRTKELPEVHVSDLEMKRRKHQALTRWQTPGISEKEKFVHEAAYDHLERAAELKKFDKAIRVLDRKAVDDPKFREIAGRTRHNKWMRENQMNASIVHKKEKFFNPNYTEPSAPPAE